MDHQNRLQVHCSSRYIHLGSAHGSSRSSIIYRTFKISYIIIILNSHHIIFFVYTKKKSFCIYFLYRKSISTIFPLELIVWSMNFHNGLISIVRSKSDRWMLVFFKLDSFWRCSVNVSWKKRFYRNVKGSCDTNNSRFVVFFLFLVGRITNGFDTFVFWSDLFRIRQFVIGFVHMSRTIIYSPIVNFALFYYIIIL